MTFSKGYRARVLAGKGRLSESPLLTMGRRGGPTLGRQLTRHLNHSNIWRAGGGGISAFDLIGTERMGLRLRPGDREGKRAVAWRLRCLVPVGGFGVGLTMW